ncbi:hypothetical protein CC2G_010711 [Coprinopsis cinerea AmutBmut pab1-1]|nr:hypothetical protein CC2G_010711 [Coprinopsis cinerea AmutBmut pab1-1]
MLPLFVVDDFHGSLSHSESKARPINAPTRERWETPQHEADHNISPWLIQNLPGLFTDALSQGPKCSRSKEETKSLSESLRFVTIQGFPKES